MDEKKKILSGTATLDKKWGTGQGARPWPRNI